jgi:beta-glucosidase/6-phospho-beta-glucosidase/beta-galactosidase
MKTTRPRMTPGSRLFRSFWIAGFECSCQINSAGARIDMTAALQHDLYAAEDYRRLHEVGIATARDGLRWHLIDRAGAYDWGSWIPMLEAARREGVQVIWDLCHYGWPDDLDIFSPEFIRRFARYAREAARVHREHTDETAFYAPVNEVNFFAWAASRDLIFPYAWGRAGELKTQMIRAALAAADEIRSIDSSARIVFPEPLIHNVPPRWRPWITAPAAAQRASQFEAWDMLAGRIAPELGGAERYLDIVGVNFYAANQWEVPGGRKLHWDAGSDDPRWVPLNRLLAEVYQRYRRPMLIAETSHYGIGRAPWLDEIARESRLAIEAGVPLEGVCLYPILDRFDWEDCTHWHNSGLWDMERQPNGHYKRVLNQEYAAALRRAQAADDVREPALR